MRLRNVNLNNSQINWNINIMNLQSVHLEEFWISLNPQFDLNAFIELNTFTVGQDSFDFVFKHIYNRIYDECNLNFFNQDSQAFDL